MIYSKSAMLAALLLCSLCTACASRPDVTNEQAETIKTAVSEEVSDPRDPFESFNRVMYDFNFNVLDPYILRPSAVFYLNYVPEPVRNGAYNMVKNLDEPSSAVNNLLQANWSDSASNLGRFMINSTIGLLGVIDVASAMGVVRKQDSFDEVMGKYGVGNGPYLMLPGLGPTTPRTLSGDYVDQAYWPLAVLNFWQSATTFAVKALHGRAELLSREKALESSLDPYSTVKESYLQNLEFKVYDGKLPEKEPEDEEFLDDLLDELD